MRTVYTHSESLNNKHYKKYRHRRALIVGLVFIVLLVGGGVLADILWLNNEQMQVTSKASAPTSYAAEQVYRTPYFQFSGKDWDFVEDGSTAGKYIYRKQRGPLTEHELTIYINSAPLDAMVPRVLPVTFNAEANRLLAASVSEPCVKMYGPQELHKPHEVVMGETRFRCDPELPVFSVIVARVCGDYNLIMNRNNKSEAKYIIMYKNLIVNPTPDVLLDVIESFRSL